MHKQFVVQSAINTISNTKYTNNMSFNLMLNTISNTK